MALLLSVLLSIFASYLTILIMVKKEKKDKGYGRIDFDAFQVENHKWRGQAYLKNGFGCEMLTFTTQNTYGSEQAAKRATEKLWEDLIGPI